MKKLRFFFAFIVCGILMAGSAGNYASKKGNMITIKVGKMPNSVEVADLNGDLLPDLVVANGGDSSVTVLLGKANGSFYLASGAPFYAGCQPNDVAIADVNNDGKPDLVFANHTKKYLTVLYGDGKGGFKPMQGSPFAVNVTPHTHGVAVADFNHDGYQDLVTDSWGNNRIEILFGGERHRFDQPGKYITVGKHPYQRLRAADLNHDGNMDIVTTNLDGNNSTVLLGDGKGGFSEPAGSAFPSGDSPFGLAIGDINADGNADLAIVNSPSITSDNKGRDGLTILLGDGKGHFTAMPGSPFTTGKSPSRVAIGDINGDGVNDIAVANYNSDSITVFLMGPEGVNKSLTLPVGHKPDGIAIARLGAGAACKILVTNSMDGTLNIITLSK